MTKDDPPVSAAAHSRFRGCRDRDGAIENPTSGLYRGADFSFPPHQHAKGLLALCIALLILIATGAGWPGSVSALFNPFGFRHWMVALLSITIVPMEHVRYGCLCAALSKLYQPLPYRQHKLDCCGLTCLQGIDYLYISVNGVLISAFPMHLLHFVINPPAKGLVFWHWGDIGLMNTLIAIPLMFLVSDFYYWWAHRLMHWRIVYPYIHKHHHRQTLPVRGFLDAINEHPIEQALGMLTLWGAMSTTAWLTGVHVVAVLVFVMLLGVLSVINHTDLDVRVRCLGFEYSVRCHEMRHRFPNFNLAQYLMGWDKFMGTYKSYDEGVKFGTE